MPQLDPASFASQLFWLAICIAFLYVVLSRVVLPSLMAALEARHKTRTGDIAQAEQSKTEAEELRQQYEAHMAESRNLAQKLLIDSDRKSKQAAEEALTGLNHTLHEQLGVAEKKIGVSRDELMRALEPAMVELTSLSVEKLLSQRPDDKHVQNVIQQLLRS